IPFGNNLTRKQIDESRVAGVPNSFFAMSASIGDASRRQSADDGHSARGTADILLAVNGVEVEQHASPLARSIQVAFAPKGGRWQIDGPPTGHDQTQLHERIRAGETKIPLRFQRRIPSSGFRQRPDW
ncbi:MAG TPA: hypothetical protein VGL53_22490, partial [Bryobacteraceae bacterium]